MSYLSPHQPVIVSSRSLTPDRPRPLPSFLFHFLPTPTLHRLYSFASGSVGSQTTSKGMYGDNGSLRLSQSLTTYMTSANGNSSLRTENSVFLALESPFYLLCVIFSLLHFFGRWPKGGAWPNDKYACDYSWKIIVDYLHSFM